jgi:hypothetical protein
MSGQKEKRRKKNGRDSVGNTGNQKGCYGIYQGNND